MISYLWWNFKLFTFLWHLMLPKQEGAVKESTVIIFLCWGGDSALSWRVSTISIVRLPVYWTDRWEPEMLQPSRMWAHYQGPESGTPNISAECAVSQGMAGRERDLSRLQELVKLWWAFEREYWELDNCSQSPCNVVLCWMRKANMLGCRTLKVHPQM